MMRHEIAGMTWDVCVPTHGAMPVPRVSINLTGGRLSITSTAFEMSGRPDAYIVLYSSEYKSIALKPASSGNPAALLVAHRKRELASSGRQVSCVALARRLVADGYAGTLMLPVQWHPDGVLWGDLTQATRSTRGRKVKAKGGAE